MGYPHTFGFQITKIFFNICHTYCKVYALNKVIYLCLSKIQFFLGPVFLTCWKPWEIAVPKDAWSARPFIAPMNVASGPGTSVRIKSCEWLILTSFQWKL